MVGLEETPSTLRAWQWEPGRRDGWVESNSRILGEEQEWKSQISLAVGASIVTAASRGSVSVGGGLDGRLWTSADGGANWRVFEPGDGAGAVVMEPVEKGGFLGFELGADGGGGANLWLPGSGSRHFDDPESFVKMNGREVFKFATRVLVASARKLLDEVGMTVDDVDVYVPHQANIRIIDHAARKLGFPPEKVVVNVQKYGNTSSGSIPLALADAAGEALTNAAKHAGVDTVSAMVRIGERETTVFVRDRGRGFEPGKAADGEGRGIEGSIEARLARVGGKARIESSPEEGTEVELTVPVGAP